MNLAISLCDACQLDWTAIGTILLAIAAFASMGQQWRQFKKLRADDSERAFKNSSVTLITDFDKQFDDLIDERIKVAKIIIENKILENPSFDFSILQNRMDDIYDFFDTLGYFVEQKYIKPEVVHQYFYHWFSMYFEFYKIYNIKELSGFDKTVWNNMPKLSEIMENVESELLGKRRKKITKDDLVKFFGEETLE